MSTAKRTQVLAECGLMIAIGTVLSYIPIFELPMGGSITLCSTLPLIIASMRHGVKWGVFTAGVHGLIQMMLGFKNVLYCTTLLSMIGCALLDYVVAYMVVGTTCVFANRIKHFSAGVAAGTVVTGLLRYFCSFLSGILIWGGYAPEDTPVWIYSLTYNGGFMIPEIILTTFAAVILMRVVGNRTLNHTA